MVDMQNRMTRIAAIAAAAAPARRGSGEGRPRRRARRVGRVRNPVAILQATASDREEHGRCSCCPEWDDRFDDDEWDDEA